MSVLIQLFIDISLFRKGPQDLPASQALLKLCIVVYGFSGLTILLIDYEQIPVFFALVLLLLDIVLLTGLLYGVLYLLGYSARFVQTLTAFIGVSTLFQLITIPLAIWTEQELARGDHAGMPGLLRFFLLGWIIAVMAHILQHALSTSRTIGLLYAVAYVAINLMIFNTLLTTPEH